MYKHAMLFERAEYLEQQFIFRGAITSGLQVHHLFMREKFNKSFF